ncbi:MAG TPA: SDR family oxidoreductase [Pseudonocardiaceae bacterium]|nr:SDR family oxidoreductase [Pseudonocardiaceae bacterium]
MIEHSTAPDAGDLSGRTALVTGGGSGIGRAIALALAGRGMDVLVVGRRAAAISGTAALCSGIRHLVADVADPKDTPRVVHAAAAELGRLDVLVNNAAILRPAPLEKIELASAREVWETNVLGPTLLAQAALPHLVASRGAIVNVSSTFGTKPAPQISQYGASKAALEQLTRSWVLELADRGVRVNAVAPGPTQSEGLSRSGLSSAQIEQVKAEEQRQIPLGRRGEPEDVAYWVVTLADPAASWVTGQVIGVDGGYLLT